MYKINIFATNDCNAKMLAPTADSPGVCNFCFRPIEKVETNEYIIGKIVSSLNNPEICEPITITGGEPLVSKYIYYLINKLVESNHCISLHTNGILLSQNKELLSKIQYISLPYDGNCAELADYYRGKGYYQILQNTYNLAYSYNLKIGLHTLTTPYNIGRLVEMGQSLEKQNYSGNIWYWFIKRFKKVNHALSIDTTPYELDEDTYHSSIVTLKNQFKQFNIIESGQLSKEITTLFIALDGNVFIYKKGLMRNELIGNVLHESLDSIIANI